MKGTLTRGFTGQAACFLNVVTSAAQRATVIQQPHFVLPRFCALLLRMAYLFLRACLCIADQLPYAASSKTCRLQDCAC